MKSTTFFSVVIPTYNRAKFISKTINSLLSQSYSNFELLIVDDGSTDNTEEVVKEIKDERIQYYKIQNGERGAARNYGASVAKGDYINFFDSDDIALPNHLEVAANLLKEEHNDVAWFHLGYAWADADGEVFRDVNNFTGQTLNAIMHRGNSLSCNGVFIRKDIIEAHQFNEDRNLSASEDYELWCRLTARFPLYYSNIITSLIIDHDSRSVRKINLKPLLVRLELLIHYLKNDKEVIAYFGKNFKRIEMEANSYIALHLANEPKHKLHSILFLFKSILNKTEILRNKRFYATIKNIITKW
ncbi:MAG: glycosyltransferase family A protein [Chitinophagaceae bacterium]|jgi:glycosyltransferase involved in cell wall biosynthesis